MKHRLSPLALALLVSFPADALLLQQGDAQFELDPPRCALPPALCRSIWRSPRNR